MFTVRHKADVIDEETGEVIAYKGEPVRNEDGSIQQTKVDLIDEKFGDALFEASGQPEDVRGFFDISSTNYNSSGTRRERLGKFKTISEMINKDWELPWYEPQRPAGFYMVDVTPTNTMVLAITRAGKGQTYIEPLIDMWLREREPNNIVINDPKGELLVKFYVPATVRNFEVVQFNLINPMKTNIYNPLALASEAARQGDNVKCSAYVENIAQVFFPVDGGDDPVWANSANNAVRDVA